MKAGGFGVILEMLHQFAGIVHRSFGHHQMA
jgi:hypothetical protein